MLYCNSCDSAVNPYIGVIIMTIEQINENKLKITLSASELASYEITPGDITPNSAKLKRFLVFLVRRAMRETGFEASGCSIMIESHSQENSLTFLVTKLSSGISGAASRPLVAKTAAKKHASVFFMFRGEKEFAEFFAAIRHEDFSNSALYGMDGRYYFKTSPQSRLYTHALEFSNPVTSQLLAARLAKDAKLICRGENFSNLL